MKPYDICIYHANCADGFASAYVCWRWHQDNGHEQPQYFAASYGDVPPSHNGGEHLWRNGTMANKRALVVDFSYSPEDMEKMCSDLTQVVWLDHHKTAIDAAAEFFKLEGRPSNMVAHLDINCSGCGIAWDYFFEGEPLPLFLARIQDRDLWKFELDGSKELHAILGAHEYSFEFWHSLCNDHARQNRVIRQGVAILMQQTKHIQTMIDQHTQPIGLMGHSGIALNCPPMWASEAGQMMLEQGSADFACTWFEQKDGSRQYSLRSNDQRIDVGELAKTMGGGGHRNAAGFVVAPDDARLIRE